VTFSPDDLIACWSSISICRRSRNTFLDLVAVLLPLGVDKLGLSVHHDHGEGVGADLHVLDVVELRADSLGHIVTVIAVFDDNSASNLFLVTVSFECGNANVFIQFNIVQMTFVVVHNLDNTRTMGFYYMLSLAMDSITLLTGIPLRIWSLGSRSRSILSGGAMILTIDLVNLMMSLRKLVMHKWFHLLTINSNYW